MSTVMNAIILTDCDCSNLAYALLGRLLVRLVDKDMTFEEYVQTKILSPLGMYDTGFKITETLRNRHPHLIVVNLSFVFVE